MSYLDKLNPQQLEAVKTTDGPMMILAGAGSGKTRTIIAKIVHLLKTKNLQPWEILAVTFSNRAAQEMKERIYKQLPELQPQSLNISTFHAFCAKVLRMQATVLGLKSSFSIYDDSESTAVSKAILKRNKIDPKEMNPSSLNHFVDQLKNQGYYLGRKNFKLKKETLEDKHWPYFLEYETELANNNAVDFGSLITRTLELFENHPQVLDYYIRKFKYILVDEYQDTNKAQFDLIKLLAGTQQNVCVVGDADQCLVEGTKILTPAGNKNIEDIKVGDLILTGSSKKTLKPVAVDKIFKKHVSQELVVITTSSGKIIKSTKEHVHFAQFSEEFSPPMYVVYLMFRSDRGFRLGVSQIYQEKQSHRRLGFAGRMIDEQAEKIWVVQSCTTEQEARYLELVLSLKYQIPTMVFKARPGKYISQGIVGDHKVVTKLFTEINTFANGKKLLKDYHLLFEYSHWYPKVNNQDKTKNIKLTLLGNKGLHRLSFCGVKNSHKKIVGEFLTPRKHKRKLWRAEKQSADLKPLYQLYRELSEEMDLNLVEQILLTDQSLLMTRATNIRPGMVMLNSNFEYEIVVSVEFEKFAGFIYDLNVPRFHNYVANSLFTHNSIYSWRGAEIKNILDFEKTFPQAKILKLEENYRSSKNIIQAASEVIKKNIYRKDKNMFTNNQDGEKIKVFECRDGLVEAQYVAQSINQLLKNKISPKEIAVFYRTNAQSRALEDNLRRFMIPYQVIGGLKFYERKEVKDIIAYLQVMMNPFDEVSLLRIINTPTRGIGDKTVSTLIEKSRSEGLNLFDFLQKTLKNNPSSLGGNKAVAGLKILMEVLTTGQKLNQQGTSPVQIYDLIIEKTGYIEILQASKKYEDQARIENLQELKSSIIQFLTSSEDKTLTAYLETITLDRSEDNLDYGRVSLMTVHAAKGLEFDHVFVVGLEESIFPSGQSSSEGIERLEEERRLFYVAVTRARKDLSLLYTKQRLLYGKIVNNPVSRFIYELPKDHIARFRV